MKKILLASISLALTFGFYACKKNADVVATPSTTTGLTASKTTSIKSSEPVTFQFNTSRSATNIITWKVLPTSSVAKAIHGSKATFNFGNPGKYIVTASDGVNIDTLLINVDSSYYSGIDTTIYLPKDSGYYMYDTAINVPTSVNSQLIITPSFLGYSDSIPVHTYADTILVKLSASTSETYPSSSPSLLSAYQYNGWYGASTGFTINYTGVSFLQSTLSLNAPTVAKSEQYFACWSNTSTTFTIVYNNVKYTGSFIVVGKTATFTWPYKSGVVISPLVVNL